MFKVDSFVNLIRKITLLEFFSNYSWDWTTYSFELIDKRPIPSIIETSYYGKNYSMKTLNCDII